MTRCPGIHVNDSQNMNKLVFFHLGSEIIESISRKACQKLQNFSMLAIQGPGREQCMKNSA